MGAKPTVRGRKGRGMEEVTTVEIVIKAVLEILCKSESLEEAKASIEKLLKD